MKANFVPTKMRYALCDAEGNPINNKIFEDIKQGDNYIAFKSNGKWGLLDEDGNILHAAEFDDIRDAVQEYIFVEKTNNNGYRRYGILNKNAQVVVPIKYVGIGYVKNFSGCIYWICKNDNLLEGLYDEQFNNILPEEYSGRYSATERIVFTNKENLVFFNYNKNEIKGYGKDYGHDYGFKGHLTIKTNECYADIYRIGNNDDKDMRFLYYNDNTMEMEMFIIPNIDSNKVFVGKTEVSMLFEKKDEYFNIYTFSYSDEGLTYNKLDIGIKIKNVLYREYDEYLILRDKKNGWYVIDTSDNFKLVRKFSNVPSFVYSRILSKIDIRLYRYEYIKID